LKPVPLSQEVKQKRRRRRRKRKELLGRRLPSFLSPLSCEELVGILSFTFLESKEKEIYHYALRATWETKETEWVNQLEKDKKKRRKKKREGEEREKWGAICDEITKKKKKGGKDAVWFWRISFLGTTEISRSQSKMVVITQPRGKIWR
jgi:hypothetical protein